MQQAGIAFDRADKATITHVSQCSPHSFLYRLEQLGIGGVEFTLGHETQGDRLAIQRISGSTKHLENRPSYLPLEGNMAGRQWLGLDLCQIGFGVE